MDIERKDGETPLMYHKRLVYGKLVNKSLADVDYTTLAQAIYGKPYAPDVARRLMYGSRFTLDLLDKQALDAVTDKDAVKDLKQQTAMMQKEAQRLRDQRREYKKELNAEGRFEHLCEVLKESADELSATLGHVFVRGDNVHLYEQLDVTEDEAILVFSDWHYGLVASNIYNTYNKEICTARVTHIVDAALKRIRLHGCRKLHVVILGDLFHGAIHTSARVASEELVCDQLMQSAELLAQAIDVLAAEVPEVMVYMTYGNHGRTVQNKNDSIHRDNMERIIPWWLEQRLKGRDNVTVVDESENEVLYLRVAGHGVCAVHGDLDSVSASPRLFTALMGRQGKDVELVLLGDKHHRESFEELGVTAQICGSLCGTDDYANAKRLFSTPSQLLLIVNRDDGVDAEYRLACQ